jgi:hypothetical protein
VIPGVIDEDVQPPERAHDLADQSLRLLGLALISPERRGAHALGLELLDNGVCAIAGRVVADRHVGTVIGEAQRGRGADAA